jgi:hypothetical protein
MSSGKAPADAPSFRLDDLPAEPASSSLPPPVRTQSSTNIPLLRPEDARAEEAGSSPLLRPEDARLGASSSRQSRPSRLVATPSFEGLSLPGSDQELRIPSPHRYPGSISDEQRALMMGEGRELPRTPTEKYHERFVTPFPKPMEKDPSQKWLEYDEPTDPSGTMSHEEWKQRRHVEVYNHEESRQMRTANNSNRQHDQNYQQRAQQNDDNFKQRGLYYVTNIDQRDWYYTNSLQLRKRGEEQRDRHQNTNFTQRDEQHNANFAQRQTHQDSNFAQREAHQTANFNQREAHQTANFNQRERQHKETVSQRWKIAGVAATTSVVVGAGVGVGTYALRQSVGRDDPTAQPTKRFVAPDGSISQPTKRFVPREESDTAAGFNPHGAARHVRMNNIDDPSGFPGTIGTMQPDDKRPVKEFGETGLTDEEVAQLGQPPKAANPYGDLTINHPPGSNSVPESNPAPKPNPAPRSNHYSDVQFYRPDSMGTPSGFPGTIGTMQPDDRRPRTEPGKPGLTDEEAAQLGQPPKPVEPVKPVNPHGGQKVRETPRPGPAPVSNPTTGSHPASKSNPRRPIAVKAR